MAYQAQRSWRLQNQLRALNVLFLVTIALACAFAIETAWHTESAQLAEADRQLARAAQELRQRYVYLVKSVAPRDLAAQPQPQLDRVLHELTASVLAGLPGVEGGFYLSGGKQLLGYAYPTYQGSGPKADVPAAERLTIVEVAAQAAASRTTTRKRLDTPTDVIMFRAVPLARATAPIGAVWVMHHMVGIRGRYRWFNIAGLTLLLGVCAGASAAAWRVTKRIDGGVAKIEGALREMEHTLDCQMPDTGIEELNRISGAIVRLGKALDHNQKRRDELERKLRHADRLAALGRLVAGVAHQVRNPLASAKLKLHLARNGRSADPARLAGAFAVVEAELDRIDRLVERLLALAKPPAPVSSNLDTNLTRYFAQRLELLKPRAAAAGASLELRTSMECDGPAALDRDRLNEILDNLIINAIDAVHDREGRVIVEVLRSEPHRLVVRVTDNGPGVPPQLRERLFEPFVTGRDCGTGLGLFLAAQFARGLGGDITYRDLDAAAAGGDRGTSVAPGSAGACFEVELPC